MKLEFDSLQECLAFVQTLGQHTEKPVIVDPTEIAALLSVVNSALPGEGRISAVKILRSMFDFDIRVSKSYIDAAWDKAARRRGEL